MSYYVKLADEPAFWLVDDYGVLYEVRRARDVDQSLELHTVTREEFDALFLPVPVDPVPGYKVLAEQQEDVAPEIEDDDEGDE
jgi:hypothetical protein